MANPKGMPQNLKPFVKGQPTINPSGRPPTPKDVREIRQMTVNEFTRITNKYLNMTKEQVITATKNPNLTAIEALVASVISKAIYGGDQMRLNALLDRLIGKVPDKIEASHSHEFIARIEQYKSMTVTELIDRNKKLLEEIKSDQDQNDPTN